MTELTEDAALRIFRTMTTIRAMENRILRGLGSGELAMTSGDLALWDAALINSALLSPRSFREMTTPVRLNNGAPQPYALGIGVDDYRGHLRLSHGGAVSGFTSQNTVWPDLRAAVVVLSNKDGSSAPGRITRELDVGAEQQH